MACRYPFLITACRLTHICCKVDPDSMQINVHVFVVLDVPACIGVLLLTVTFTVIVTASDLQCAHHSAHVASARQAP